MKILRKITDKKILYIFTLFILIFMPVLKQGSFYLEKYNILNNSDSINTAIILYISMPFFIYIYIKNFITSKRKIDIYDYIFFVLITAGIIATILAVDKEMSLFGKSYRHEGLLSIISYYLLFITWKVEGNQKDVKNLLRVIIFMALFNCIYSFLQVYTSTKLVLRYTPNMSMATGLLGNPNFFGSYIVTVISLITTKFLLNKKISIKDLIIILLLYVGLVNCQSTGPYLTYLITIIFIIIYLFIKKKTSIKKVAVLLISLIIITPTLIFINKQIFNIEKCEICDFVKVVSGKDIINDENINNDTSINPNPYFDMYTITNGRTTIWKNSLKIVKNNLINGVGYDNFYLEYYKDVNLTEVYFMSSDGQMKAYRKYTEIVDNAHNVYLHTLVSSGLIGIVPYIILCLLTFIKGLKSKNNLVIMLLGGFVAYSIQAFANISVVQVAPIYYIIIGLILAINE